MPQIATWSHLPAAVRAHLVERMHDRKISLQDLDRLRVWIESKPNVPERRWYKYIGSFKLCGEGPYPKRFFSRAKSRQNRSSSARIRSVHRLLQFFDNQCLGSQSPPDRRCNGQPALELPESVKGILVAR
jgi:hypothetical protein